MVHCCKCGVLDDVGESVICEDCSDNRSNLIDSFIGIVTRKFDGEVYTKKEIVKMLEALR